MKQRNRIVRLQVEFSEGYMLAIDDFWFNERLPSRAAAVREILRRGLDVQKRTANMID